MRRIAVLAVASLCLSLSALAAGITLTVSTSGTYSAGTPTTAWTAPNTAWSFSYNISNTPAVNSFVTGSRFDVPFTNFVYKLNNVVVNVGTVDIVFYSTSNGGLMNIGLFGSNAATSLTNGFAIFGAQAYTGGEATPTVLNGTYPETANDLIVAGAGIVQPNGSMLINPGLTPTPTPAPTSLLLMLAGLAMGTFYLMSRRSARA